MSSLFPEYVVLPEVFKSDNVSSGESQDLLIRLIFRGARFERGSFLRNLRGGKWAEDIQASSSSIVVKKVLKWLITNKRLLPIDIQHSDNWLDEAVQSHDSRALNGIICPDQSPLAENIPSAHVSELDDLILWWKERTDILVSRQVDAAVRELEPLLRFGRSIFLVDPYFNPLSPDYSKFAQKYLSIIKKNEYTPRITIHSSEKSFKDHNEYKSLVKELGSMFRSQGLEGSICHWNSRVIPNSHDRYLLTDIGGCLLGAGFGETQKRGQNHTLTVISCETRKILLQTFDPSPNVAKGLIAQNRFVVDDRWNGLSVS